MTAQDYQQIETHGAVVDLSDRAKFRLTGADRVRYLNGQVTNDVRLATQDRAIYACLTDIKGRIVGDVFIHAQGDALLLDAEPGLREIIATRLERYIIADDVTLEDVTEQYQLWHTWGAAGTEPKVSSEEAALSGPMPTIQSARFGISGQDYWVPCEGTTGVSLLSEVRPTLSSASLESWRILRGIPRWPNELNAETFPPEAALDDRAISYSKGCYLGQEILSRIRTTGKMPRTLLHWQSETAVVEGETILSEGREVGRVTSVTVHPVTQRWTGLSYVKQGVASEITTSSGAKVSRCDAGAAD